eukprot:TRINITY_DN3318_c0_g1_i1.p1 TRINITY_DN3318_c0_g1~~TRINITY_DN3318_c0_g1_i1.p1  ORF type:complete len:396 (-),score=86.98 TRINITY_DN3318_c0_g1_i1:171-1358(-)
MSHAPDRVPPSPNPKKKHNRAASVDAGVEEEKRRLAAAKEGRHHKTLASKYDFVKVRVWLDEHYYVLSRFLVSRMLTVTKVAFEHAVKASLELKKQLVDQNKLDVQQEEMTNMLFAVIGKMGYTDQHLQTYKMMTRFHHQRVPLIIFIAGTGCIGKSILATQLAERLNLPSVLQTDLVYEMMSAVVSELKPAPVWGRPFESDERTVSDWKREAAAIRKGLEGDIAKAFEDGKPIIIEGTHLDLSLYQDVLALAIAPPPTSKEPPKSDSARPAIQMPPGMITASKPLKKLMQRKHNAVVVPFLLTEGTRDHRCLVESWLSSLQHPLKQQLGEDLQAQATSLLRHYAAIEAELLAGTPMIAPTSINVHEFEDTLDTLHTMILDKIAAAMEVPPDSET